VGHLKLPVSTFFSVRMAWQVAKQAVRDVLSDMFSAFWTTNFQS
jgi:hypothetical protein